MPKIRLVYRTEEVETSEVDVDFPVYKAALAIVGEYLQESLEVFMVSDYSRTEADGESKLTIGGSAGGNRETGS